MKPLLVSILSITILASCGGGGEDKKALLDKKKSELAALEAEVKQLEIEVAATDTTQKGKIKDVVIAAIQPTQFRHYIDVQGTVDADENVEIRPTMGGLVRKILVHEGEQVRTGQVLAELDHDVASKQLSGLQPQLALAKDTYDRQQRLWNQKIGSEMQLLQARTQKESLEAQAATIQEQIDLSIIKSPINGTVDAVGLKIGELANPMMPAFRVVNLSGLKVKGEVAEAYASRVKKGHPVVLHFPDLNTNVESKITYAEKVIDPLTRTFTTEASLPHGEYHPNMVAILKIVDYEKDGALILPINVIQSSGSEQFVYVAQVTGNKAIAKKTVVTIGETYDGKAEILTGLNPNDNVVVSGQIDLVDGMQIRY